MTEFLKIVAEHYVEKVRRENGGRLDPLGLRDYLFVYPNRRSALFMGQYLSELAYPTREQQEAANPNPSEKIPIMAPRTTTISDIYQLLSPYKLEDPMAQLFRLYEIFNQFYGEKEEFEKFVFWGQMLLSDFNDIDKYAECETVGLHDKVAQNLYINVFDHKQLDARFKGLDEATAKVLVEFWRGIRIEDLTLEAKDTFLKTWSILYDVYKTFRQHLESNGLAYEGMMQREVVERITRDDEESRKALQTIGAKKVVFVCLTALSRVDERLLEWLVENDRAEFCWDWADPRIRPGQQAKGRRLPVFHASYFPSRYQHFRNELSGDELLRSIVPDRDRHVELIEVPSAVGQAAQARRQLQLWMERGYIIPEQGDASETNGISAAQGGGASAKRARRSARSLRENPIHTAVVLPDENMLFPMLYAMPQELQPFNVTMGYSIRQTPTSALMDALAHVQFDAVVRRGGEEILLNYKSVQALLSHSYVTKLADADIRKLSKQLQEENRFRIPYAMLLQVESLRPFLTVADSATEVGKNLLALLDYLLAQDLPDGEGNRPDPPYFANYEREFIYNYRVNVVRLMELLEQYSDIPIDPDTFYQLLQRLVANVQVPFSGEPLDGVQVMGVLETRSLDFDNLIILSMNEGRYPAKPVQNTFIPMQLREVFGLPTQQHRDSVFAYHFYRMLSRASRVTLIYDSRSEGVHLGEVSRYVLQLKYQCPEIRIHKSSVNATYGQNESYTIRIAKDTDEVRKALDRFRPGGGRKLSATAIKDYLTCPLRFYLKVLHALYEDDELEEGMNAGQFGTIVHRSLELLYQPAEGNLHREIRGEYLQSLLDESKKHPYSSRVWNSIMTAFAEVMPGKNPEGYMRIGAEGAKDFVEATLRYDRDHAAPFIMVGAEWEQAITYRVNDELSVSMRAIYDRIDLVQQEIMGRDGMLRRQNILRIVDYKTESARNKMIFKSEAELLTEDGSKTAFQLMLYALLLKYATPEQLREVGLDKLSYSAVSPHLYFIREMFGEKADDKQYLTPLMSVETYLDEKQKSKMRNNPVWDVEPHREAFEEAFRQTLIDIFDTSPGRTFDQCKDPAEGCKYCPFTEICRLEGN